MILIFVNHNSDWKYRADHVVEIIATGSKRELLKKRDEAIREFFKEGLEEDLAAAHEGDPPREAQEKLEKKIKKMSMAELHKRWENMEENDRPQRWEMKTRQGGEDIDGDQRIFCGGGEGESWGCSWTILKGDVKEL